MSKFTHINEQGNAKMVDVSNKNITKRTAQAHSSITVNETIYQQIIDNTNKKAMYLTLHKLLVLWRLKHIDDYTYVSSSTFNRYRCSI